MVNILWNCMYRILRTLLREYLWEVSISRTVAFVVPRMFWVFQSSYVVFLSCLLPNKYPTIKLKIMIVTIVTPNTTGSRTTYRSATRSTSSYVCDIIYSFSHKFLYLSYISLICINSFLCSISPRTFCVNSGPSSSNIDSWYSLALSGFDLHKW